MTVPVSCPYCGLETTTDPYWMTPHEVLRSHWYGACKRLPWWRRWFR